MSTTQIHWLVNTSLINMLMWTRPTVGCIQHKVSFLTDHVAV